MRLHTSAQRAARLALAATILLALDACKLDVTNPNAATEQGVLTTAAGLRALAIGMQGRLGNAMEETIYVPGLVSGELGNTNATQSTTREFQLFPTASANSAIEETNVDLLDIWTKNYLVVKSANDIIDNIDNVGFAPGTKAGMLALAKLHKAMAFGNLIEAFRENSRRQRAEPDVRGPSDGAHRNPGASGERKDGRNRDAAHDGVHRDHPRAGFRSPEYDSRNAGALLSRSRCV